MTVIKVMDRVDGDLGNEAWTLYLEAFRELNGMTVQRHLMTQAEFTEVMTDRRVDKYLVWEWDGRLIGLSTYTNVLQAMPLISPAYFARRWPRLYGSRKIWYCGFVAVPGHERGVFAMMVEAMYRAAEQHGGVIALDICRHNITALRLDKVIRTLLTRISDGRVRCEEADAQTFHIYETAPTSAP